MKVDELIEHLTYHKAHYSRALYLNQNPAERASQLDAIQLAKNATLLEKVEYRPLEIVGDFVAYPCTDPIWAKRIEDVILEDPPPAVESDERLVTLPTRGVFAEAKLGHCNASEEIDNTRFWDWQRSLIPHMAPEIAAIQAGRHTVKDLDLKSTPFPQPILNIVNPPAAPDPTGLAAALNVLGTPNIFRDMSGRAEVADLLKKLSDNFISIAEAANKARGIQNKHGENLYKQQKEYDLGLAKSDTELEKAKLDFQKEQANRVTPEQAHDVIKLSENEMRKGNKTPEEHATLSKDVQSNIPGASSPQTVKPSQPGGQTVKSNKPRSFQLQIEMKYPDNSNMQGRFRFHIEDIEGKNIVYTTPFDKEDIVPGKQSIAILGFIGPRMRVNIFGYDDILPPEKLKTQPPTSHGRSKTEARSPR